MTIFSRYMDTVGDGTGTKVATGDYSGAAEDFIFKCVPPFLGAYVHRVIVHIQDTSGMSAVDYGNITSGLANGIQVLIQRDGVTESDLTDGLPVTSNGEWTRYCYDADVKTWSTGDEMLTVRWTFAKSGEPIRLEAKNNDSLVFRLNDDFTGLTDHTFLVQGNYYGG